MPIDKDIITAHFYARFHSKPRWVVRAPGRVKLIGEHTDYNDGFVLPLAIDRAAWIALRRRDDRRVVVHSIDYDQTAEFSLDSLKPENAGWIEYFKGTAWSLIDASHQLSGWEGVLAGDVPIGAGLSSSAALEMAAARTFAAVGDIPWDKAAMAKISQRAENKWVGVNCGIMDQLISSAGKAGHAMLIDCRSLDMQPAPLPPDSAVVVLDTATRRGLVDSAYNERRSQCEEAARYFDVSSLRDVSVNDFLKQAGDMAPVPMRRARHVITENERTLRAAEAMRCGDAVELGRLMNQSHDSLCNDYEVSNHALSTMVECAQSQPGCFGARMTGAGFGGCAVALIRSSAIEKFIQNTSNKYKLRTGNIPAVYVCQATDGANVV